MRFLLLTVCALSFAQIASAAIPTALNTHTVGSLTLATDLPAREGEELAHRIAVAHRLITARLEALLQRQATPHPLTVVLFKDPEAWERFTHHHAPERLGSGAWYDGARRWVVTHRLGHDDSAICHELVHASLGSLLQDLEFTRYRRPGWPIWLEEGLAEHFGHCVLDANPVRIGERSVERDALLLNATEDGDLPAAEGAPQWKVEEYSGPGSAVHYAQSAVLSEKLVQSVQGRVRIRSSLLEGTPLRPHTGPDEPLDSAPLPAPAGESLQPRWVLHGGGHQTGSPNAPGVLREKGEAFITRSLLPMHSWRLKWSGTWTGKSASLSLGDHRASGSAWTVRLAWNTEAVELSLDDGPVLIRIPGPRKWKGATMLQVTVTGGTMEVSWQGRVARAPWPGSHRISRVGFGVDAGSLQTHSLELVSLLNAPSDVGGPGAGGSQGTSPRVPDRQSNDN